MIIRKKITIQFSSIVATILLLSCLFVYFLSAIYVRADFNERLKSKAENVATLLFNIEEIDKTFLRKIEKDNPTSLPEERIIIINNKNELEYSSDNTNAINISTSLLTSIRKNKWIEIQQNEFSLVGFMYQTKNTEYLIIAAANDVFGTSRLKDLRTVLVAVFFLGIIITLVSGWIFAGRALKPISVVIDSVNEISIHNLNLRLDEGNKKDEIAQLSQTFNNMLNRLETAFKIQENFIANASHELRTPLHSISGQLEVILLKERTAEAYQTAIQSVLDDMRALNSLSNKLLLLAQSNSNKASSDFKHLRIDDILWQARQEILKRAPEYKINIILSDKISDEKELMMYGNEMLLKTVVLNLMDNGCKYSNNKTVDVSLTHEGNKIVITYIDHGIGIPKADLTHIFEPFHRGKNTTPVKGHGIGLSLVKRIIKLHGGYIDIESKENVGTTVTTSFGNS